MAKISSELSIRDGFSKNLNKYINGLNNVINTMEKAESSASGADFGMPKAESGVVKTIIQINNLGNKVDELNNKSVSRVSSGFGGLSKTIITVNQGLDLVQRGFQAIEGAMTSVDERNSTDARLSLIKDQIHTQDQLEGQIMAMANLTRSKYEDTADLVAKVGRQDIFKGQNDKAVKFAEDINKSFIVSGASVDEASNSTRQLTQALASGVLRGDEFNSVMENAPVLAEMIANRLGVTKGKMRELAEEGKLTAQTVANAVLASGSEIDKQFNQMPITFGQEMTVIHNKISEIANTLSQPGQAFNNIILKVQELISWLDTMEGQQFMTGLSSGISIVIDGLIWVATLIGKIYTFFTKNWSAIEPLILGIGSAVVIAVVALKAYSFITAIITAMQGIAAAATFIFTKATWAQAAAQWGLNAAMYANPIVWIIGLIVAVIAIIIIVVKAIVNLWRTNIDFKVGVIKIWNSILGFFDNVGLFFMKVGYAICDAFSYAKVGALTILQALANGAIGIINGLISAVNKIPGVNIKLIDQMTFASEAAVDEEAKRQARDFKLAEAEVAVAQKAADRESKLLADEQKWRSQADASEKKANDLSKSHSSSNADDVYVTGGGLDKEVDLSNQTLRYLADIAENQALRQFDALNKFMWIVYDDSESKLNDDDKNILMSQAGAKANVYYLQYQGTVEMNTQVKQGEDWETIKRRAQEETQIQIDIGLSTIDKVVSPQ